MKKRSRCACGRPKVQGICQAVPSCNAFKTVRAYEALDRKQAREMERRMAEAESVGLGAGEVREAFNRLVERRNGGTT